MSAFLSEWESLPLLASQASLPETAREAQRRVRSSHDASGLAHALRALGTGRMPNYFPKLGELKLPVLLVVGEKDPKFTAIAEQADIVVLTNLGDHCRDHRITQLARHGINHRVETNQGGKGGPVAALVAEYGDPVTVFVDDLATHHESVARHAPRVHRLQLIAEPAMAPSVPPAPFAHARIDDWMQARDWIAARFAANEPAEQPFTPIEGAQP